MKRSLGFWLAGLVAALMGVTATWTWVRADLELHTDFKADDAVETLTVRIDVGGGGEDLQEPVALDLGLGFPLWLDPVGRVENEAAPFGAVPQETTAGGTVAAGSSATFTFRASGEPGRDQLETTPQLMDGVQLSDIARIGLSSQGSGNWELAGYEIQINDKPFATHADINKKARETQDNARFRLAELGLQMTPLETEANNLRALADAGLATTADQARLVELEGQLGPLATEKQWLEGQLAGRLPWFVEEDFRSPWRTGTPLESAAVTLSTQTHAGADTQNYVYFRTGGHKYLLGSPSAPLSGELGPQRFPLDLAAGPLEAADNRGYAVGMLGHAHPYGKAPDRWHPQRLVVEIAGRVVYDSDESPIDRNSLESIRIIPPVHVDEAGSLVTNAPTTRETYLWEAGKGAGLDLAGGGALDLPASDDPDYPLPEPGLPEGDLGEAFPGGDPGFPPGYDPFPGEWGGGPGWGPGWGDPFGGWPGWDPGWGAPPSWIDLVLNLLIDLDVLPPGVDPPPVGDPFQIETVAITSGWKADDVFTIEWTVSGDEGAIDHYDVSLLELYPHQAVPFGPAVISDTVAAGTHQYTAPLPALVPGAGMYVAPMVVAVPSDPADTPHERIGPAKPLFPAGTNPLDQLLVQNVFIWSNPPPPGINVAPVSFGGDPGGSSRAIWAAGQVESHNAILFDIATPAWNIGIRPEVGDEIMLFLFDPDFVGKHRLAFHLGFLGGAGGGNSVDLEITCRLIPDVGPGLFSYPVQNISLVTPAGGPPEPMTLFEQVVDRADGPGVGNYQLMIWVRVTGGAVDAAHPPALFGVRMNPEP